MARLTEAQWRDVRETWECDPREGYDWLANELDGVISRQAISKKANKEGWVKRPGEVAQPNGESCATKPKVAQPKEKPVAMQITNQPEPESNNDRGRPTKFKPEYCDQAYKLCLLLGATDGDLAKFFDVTEQTINNWKIQFPEFFESLRAGKDVADANVALSLFNRCIGYTHTAEKIFNNAGEVIRAEYTEHYPPDVSAIKVWLYNRQPEVWKDKQEITISNKVDKELLDMIENKIMADLEDARLRQRQVLIERGIIIENDE